MYTLATAGMMQNNMRKIIGITGTIGSGKSTAARIMHDLGAYVINADIVARNALLPGSETVRKIHSAFGDGVMLCKDAVNRKKLASFVFADPKKLVTLNSITLPFIKEEMYLQADIAFRIYKYDIVVFDAPLLEEAGLIDGLCDVWLITAPLETKIARIIQRDKTTRQAALLRINTRKSDEEMKKFATVVVENNGTYGEFYKKVESIYLERYS